MVVDDQLVVENVDEMVEKLVEDELVVDSLVVGLVEEEDVVLPRIEKIVIVSRPRLSCMMVLFNSFCMPSMPGASIG